NEPVNRPSLNTELDCLKIVDTFGAVSLSSTTTGIHLQMTSLRNPEALPCLRRGPMETRQVRQPLLPSFDELRDRLSVAASSADVERALARFADRNGFKWFTYLALHEVSVRGMSNYPRDWQQHYL